MRPELQRLTDELTEVRMAIAGAADMARPATNGWTVAQVMEHLAKSHRAAMPNFEAAMALAPERVGDDPVRYSFIERQVIQGMGGKLPMRIPVPQSMEPGAAGSEAREACLKSIDALLDLMRRADGKALAGLRVRSPVSERLRLGFLPYLDALVAHAEYHRSQI